MKRILLFFLLLSPLFVTAQESVESLFSQASKYYEAKEHEKAYPLMLQAAEQGYYKAECVIGHYYFFGFSPLEQNYAKAFEWYKKASDHGNISAKQKLGYMYHAGLYVSANKEKAYQYYIDAAQKGDVYSCINLGFMYLDTYTSGLDNGEENAFPPIDKKKVYAKVPDYGYGGVSPGVSSKPEPGETNRQYEEKPAPPEYLYEDTNYRVPVIDSMGHLNLDVIPVCPAEEWFLNAAKQDSTDGLFYLAYYYTIFNYCWDEIRHLRGIDIILPQKSNKHYTWLNYDRLYEMAATNGSSRAQAAIGYKYMMSHQFEISKKWLEKAQKAGIKTIEMGEFSYMGEVVLVDEAIAICKHFLKGQPYIFKDMWFDDEEWNYYRNDNCCYVIVENAQEKEGLIKIDMNGRLISKTPIKFDENNSLYEHIKIENEQLLFDGQPF
ncbi:MAG: sel1 repeat family protein [Bacteroidales bacterium]|nr:sel1 repeat family protein [Bacteroidales bacterium]